MSEQKTTTVNSDDFQKHVLERAKTRDAAGKVTSELKLSNLWLTLHWRDPLGQTWEVDSPSPPSGGKNKILFIFLDDALAQARIYCVPTADNPGAFTRYTVPRIMPTAGKPELVMDKTANYDLIVASIAYELREVDSSTPPLTWQDEIRESEA